MTTCLLYEPRIKNRAGLPPQDTAALVLKSLVPPQLHPVIEKIFEIPELISLAGIVSLGENQLHHLIRMAEKASQVPERVLAELGLTRDTLLTALLFHDIGKGRETDDRHFDSKTVRLKKIPNLLRKYGVPEGAEIVLPRHLHLLRGVQLAERYNLDRQIIQAVALHHHVKITPRVLSRVAGPLAVTPVICSDILHFRPAQYAARGGNLAQLVGILDQLCAIERKFHGKVYLAVEPDKLEEEVVKDLIIGVAEADDPRLDILGFAFHGQESVILLDLRSFGEFVQTHTEYQVQSIKKEVLNTIRSLTRAGSKNRNRDAAGLIGGDEFVIITSIAEPAVIEKIIHRVATTIRARTGLDCRAGYGTGESIPENFHKARNKANAHKTGGTQLCRSVAKPC